MNGKRILKFCILHFAFCILVLIPLLASAGIRDTKHNMSVSGTGDVKAVSETQICIFCHTPHNSSPAQPLWNHEVTEVVTYINYWSPTLQSYASEAEAPPIDGFSKLCLSCHDGTVAIGSLISCSEEILMVTVPVIDASGKLVGGPLANKRNSADPPLTRLNWPINDPDIKLHPTQGRYGVQCTSCHDPHTNKAAGGWPPFWHKSTHDEVCIVCHEQIPPGDIEW
jgi:hypothetical protein